MANVKRYDNESISSLKGAERVRLRPAVIFGSDDIVGCEHAFFEILSNSIDEAREGYGREIRCKRYADGSIEIEDFGRGIPLDYNSKEERYNWELVYCELYAGGKYNNNDAENYEYSLGLNGLGACATQYASELFDVDVWRDGYHYSLHFEAGENIGGLKKEESSRRETGTRQRFKPDRKVFTETDIPLEYFQRVLKQQAVVNAGIRFSFVDEGTGESFEYLYPEGILAYVEELDGQQGLCEPVLWHCEGEGRDRSDLKDYRVKADIAFCFNNHSPRQEYYHNSSFLEYGGSPDRAVRQAFVAAFDKVLKQRDLYKANESKISYQDIEDSLLIVISSFSTQTSYENQTKKAINNRYIQYLINDFLREQIDLFCIENQAASERILEQLLINKRSRESAEKQRLNVQRKLMGNVDINNRVKKFVDCRSRDINRRELYIVEGDSALGSVKLGRDSDFQAVMTVRGKILNCLKSDYGKIFKNDIITDLIKVLGCGVELEKGGKSSKAQAKKGLDSEFSLDKLRWDKVIICTDADVDGFQIRTLILAMFYRLMPSLIRVGKVYIAESPLYEISYKRGKTEQSYFAYDEREKAILLEELGESHCSIQRSKGLGENEPEMMWQTTMNPQTRRLIQILPEAEADMADVFDLLLGENLAGRKEYIRDYGSMYLEALDLA
ncbi:MAG: toprim domain-containing protein [Eubacteriales bacterium]|nr:toprim domain-containing protein [Eubacteriales bacterium]